MVVITGPTATGKTQMAFRLAKKFSGELISADSRHVYKGMDIVTGKDLQGWHKDTIRSYTVQSGHRVYTLHPYRKDSVALWMYDVVSPDEPFSVAAYTDCARQVCADIKKRNALPIIVGGTGLYIASLFHKAPSSLVPPDWEFRKTAETMSVGELAALCTSLSKETYEQMNQSDRSNPRRLIRRIEILRALGHVPSQKQEEEKYNHKNILWIGLTAENALLYERIDQRVDARIQEGALLEVQSLSKAYSWDLPSMSAIGYKQFHSKQSRDPQDQQYRKAVQSWKFAEHAYARRQKTWAKKYPYMQWFDVGNADWMEKVEAVVSRWYTTHTYADKN